MAVMGLLLPTLASPPMFPWQVENQGKSGHQDRKPEPV